MEVNSLTKEVQTNNLSVNKSNTSDINKKKKSHSNKELELLIHDIYKNIPLEEINDNLEYYIYSVKDLYYEFEKVKNSEDEVINEITNLFNTRLLIDPPVYTEKNIQELSKIIELLKLVPQPEQRTPEWYTFRNNRLTASDLATALNKNPYSRRKDLILKKCGHETPWKPGAAILHGVKYEDVAILIYSVRNKVKVVEYGCVPHPNIPFFGASPDGICDPESENRQKIGYMLEIKCPKSRPITGFPPEYYEYQVQGQLEVCDLEYCDFLECNLHEYNNKDEYMNDSILDKDGNVNINYQKNGLEKGVVIELYDHKLKKSIFKYGDLNMTKEKLEKWCDEIIDESLETPTIDYLGTSYWKLIDYCCTLIKRDKERFKEMYIGIKQFWDDVLHYRNIGTDSLLKKKTSNNNSNKVNKTSKIKFSKEVDLSFLD
jgi:putative phage-type endonuclease